MSSIKLISFAALTPGGDILFGGTDLRREGEQHVVTATSVPIPYQRPASGMHLLYGFRDTLEEIGRRRTEAREFGAEFQFAEVEFDVGKIHEAMVDEKRWRHYSSSTSAG